MKNLFDQEPYARRGEADARIADLEGAAHPDLADHDALGLATQAELDAHAATSHGGTHPDLAAHDTLGLATQAELDSHAAAADPHPAYETSAEAAAKVTAHEAAADPHTGYLQESVVSGLATPAIALGSAAAAGTGTTPIRHNSTIQAFDATVPNVIEPDDAAAVGVVNFAARRDHEHGIVTAVAGASTFGDAAAEGTATSFARSDHKHSREANPVTAHEAAADPHTGYLQESVISGLATPAIVLGSAAAAGTGTTPIRHNSTIAAFDATAPSTQAFGDAAVVGTVAFAARRDHKHAMPANPVTAHEAAGDPHPAYETSAEAAAKVTAHEAAADPHAGYQKESEKDVASGYAGLDVNVRVPVARLGSGTPAAATVLRGDGIWTTHDATGDPHSQYATDADLTTHAATAGHTHPDLAAHDTLGLATQAELDAHAAGPHGGGVGHSHDGTGGDTSLIVGGTAEAGASIPVASSTGAIAIGDFANAGTGTQPIAIGSGVNATAAPSATGQGGIAIGASNGATFAGARAGGICAVAIGSGDAAGTGANASANNAVALGLFSSASGTDSFAGGRGASSGGVQAVALLGNAGAAAAIAVGTGAGAAIAEAIAVGRNANAHTGAQAIAIGGGVNTTASPLASAQGAIAVGGSNSASVSGAKSSQIGSVAIGSGSGSAGGLGAVASGTSSIALGGASSASPGASASAAQAIAIGRSANASHANSVAMGAGASTTAVNQIMLGTAAETVHIPGTLTLSAWTAFTPVVKFGAVTATLTTNNTQYKKLGRLVVMQIMVKVSNLNGGTGNLTITLPFPVRAPAGTLTYVTPMGHGIYADGATGAVYPAFITPNNAGDVVFRSTSAQPSAVFTHNFPKALVSPDEIHATITYEASS